MLLLPRIGCRARTRRAGSVLRTRRTPISTALPLLATLIAPGALNAQGAPGRAGASALPPADSTELHDRARDAQVRFERVRFREMPYSFGHAQGRCDEVIGRLCIHDEGDDGWRPSPDPPPLVAARQTLLATLDSIALRIPGDHWVLGQRIRYLAEAGIPSRARLLAHRCRLPERWRCDLLLGYAHYRDARIVSAESAFQRGLEGMPPALRSEWLDPELLLESDQGDWLAQASDPVQALERLWFLSDALFLTEGNDRRAAHLSRRVHAMISENARNPHQLRWGRDLAEVVIRYGWPAGWERSRGTGSAGSHVVIGRDQPAALRTLPPREVLEEGNRDLVPWLISEGHAQSAHIPPFLDTLAALDGQFGRFWRPGGVIVIAAWSPPPGAFADSTGREWSDAAAGLFVERNGALILDVRSSADPDGTFRLSGRAPAGERGIVSLEGFGPASRRAWRTRAGVGLRPLPPGRLAISDIVLLTEGADPATLAAMLPLMRGSTALPGGSALTLAFEVYGPNLAGETVAFRVRVERTRVGALTRLVRWIGLGGSGEEAAVAWEEAGPDHSRPLFRSLAMTLPILDAGPYQVVVELQVPGHQPLEARRAFRITDTPHTAAAPSGPAPKTRE